MMGFIKKAFSFVGQPSHSRTMGLVVMLLLITAVSITVAASQQQQTTKQQAAPLATIPNNADQTASSNSETPTSPKLCVKHKGLLWVTNINIRYYCPLIDNAFVDEATCEDACSKAQPTSAPATPIPPTPTPTTTPNLFTCNRNITSGNYKGEYSCKEIVSGGVNCLEGWTIANPPSAFNPDPRFTGTTCPAGQGCCRKNDPIPTPTPTATPPPTNTPTPTISTCIKISDVNSLAAQYIQGNTTVTLKQVNAIAIQYKKNPCR